MTTLLPDSDGCYGLYKTSIDFAKRLYINGKHYWCNGTISNV